MLAIPALVCSSSAPPPKLLRARFAMSTANSQRAGEYENTYGGTEAGQLVDFNSSDSDAFEAPQPPSPQYINSNDNINKKRGNGVDHNIGPIQHDIPAAAVPSSANQGKALKIIIYGAVNAMMAIPILYGYAAIIFRCFLLPVARWICSLRCSTSSSSSIVESSSSSTNVAAVGVARVFGGCHDFTEYEYQAY